MYCTSLVALVVNGIPAYPLASHSAISLTFMPVYATLRLFLCLTQPSLDQKHAIKHTLVWWVHRESKTDRGLVPAKTTDTYLYLGTATLIRIWSRGPCPLGMISYAMATVSYRGPSHRACQLPHRSTDGQMVGQKSLDFPRWSSVPYVKTSVCTDTDTDKTRDVCLLLTTM